MIPASPRSHSTSLVLGGTALSMALLAVGATQGIDWATAHNLVRGLVSTFVGAHVLMRRPGQRIAALLLVSGVVDSILYATRQVGLVSTSASDAWIGWFGVWPTSLAIGLSTLMVMTFPEGRFISARWANVGAVVAVAVAACTALSALWPVQYDYIGITTPFPFHLPGQETAHRLWTIIGHPSYSAMCLLWLVAVAARWRVSDVLARRQLGALLVAVAGSLVILFTELAVFDHPWAGLTALAFVPVVIGWTLERMSLARVIEDSRAHGHLDVLSPRERDVLELLAQGLSNTAIAAHLHLSVKTVEPAISSIFRKLQLADEGTNHRRVQAVLAYWREYLPEDADSR